MGVQAAHRRGSVGWGDGQGGRDRWTDSISDQSQGLPLW
jgi:hypothetical protein